MKEKEKKIQKIIIVIVLLIAAIFGLVIAYSALTATLHIQFSTITYNSVTWNVGFEPGRINAIKRGSNETVCGEAVINPNFVEIDNISLYTLHDKCIYPLKIKNTGTIDAVLGSIAAKTPASSSCDTSQPAKMICGNITYKLTIDEAGTKLLNTMEEIEAKKGQLDVYLYTEYTGLELGIKEEQNSGGFALNYFQK